MYIAEPTDLREELALFTPPGTFHARQFTIVLPISQVADDRVAWERIQWALSEILSLSGGLTGSWPCQGYWITPERCLCEDTVIPVVTVVPDMPGIVQTFIELVEVLAAGLGQREIFMLSQLVWMPDTKSPATTT